jgi:hypothetical protein
MKKSGDKMHNFPTKIPHIWPKMTNDTQVVYLWVYINLTNELHYV